MARGKSWKVSEDVALVRAILRVLQDTHTSDRGAIAFWMRVTALYEELVAGDQAPPRTYGAVESRWKNLQASIATFIKCLANASRGAAEADHISAALELYREQDSKRHAFENLEVWECLRNEVPQYEEFVSSSTSFYMMQKKREGGGLVDDELDELDDELAGAHSRKKKRASLSVYDAEAALLGRVSATPPRETNGRASGAHELSRETQRGAAAVAVVSSPQLVPQTAPAAIAPALTSRATAPSPAARSAEEVDKARHRKAMQEAAETRNTLLAEQNAIAAEKNMIALFSSRDDAVSTEFFDLKRRIALAKLKRDFADFLR